MVSKRFLALALILCFVAAAAAQTRVSGVNHPRPAKLHRGNAPVRTASKNSHLDPSNFLVVIIAALILYYGASRALRPPFMDMSPTSQEAMAYEEAAEAETNTLPMFTAMSVLVTILFCFISSLALGALVYPYVDRYTDHRFSREVDVPWFFTKSWLLNNILAFSLIIFFLTSVRLSSLKVASSLLILAFFYDIFWVFISSSIFGKNVMVTVATGLNVPIKILVRLTTMEDVPYMIRRYR
eukprot:754872-Hanusia_phi.AAC.4